MSNCKCHCHSFIEGVCIDHGERCEHCTETQQAEWEIRFRKKFGYEYLVGPHRFRFNNQIDFIKEIVALTEQRTLEEIDEVIGEDEELENEKGLKITGYEYERLLHRNSLKIVRNDFRDLLRKRLQELKTKQSAKEIMHD